MPGGMRACMHEHGMATRGRGRGPGGPQQCAAWQLLRHNGWRYYSRRQCLLTQHSRCVQLRPPHLAMSWGVTHALPPARMRAAKSRVWAFGSLRGAMLPSAVVRGAAEWPTDEGMAE